MHHADTPGGEIVNNSSIRFKLLDDMNGII